MTEEFGTIGYTPPVGRFGTTDEQQAAYLDGHAVGWDHANVVTATDAPAARPDSAHTTAAACAWAGTRWKVDGRVYLRAWEGFTDGADAFYATVYGG